MESDLAALQIVEDDDEVIQFPSSSTGHSSLYDFYFVRSRNQGETLKGKIVRIVPELLRLLQISQEE
ncbi:hypothetical protein J1N35_028756 [Gossypium stocksii]|uniref:Uncharacterized protein n=1 Tax=Gossypium stocksii TaxID=47602 RepID=A0A9D3UYI8_9ROSI|nr:hypothetical protein J1N35_028756 [Gossypium stocksii]